MTHPAIVAVVTIVALFAAPARISAQLVFPPTITRVAADDALESLHITGMNFGDTTPTVKLADVSLAVTSFSDTEIVAKLPARIPRASYGLLVTRYGTASVESPPFQVTLGAVGPPGPQGIPGPPGPPGPSDLSGLTVQSVKDSVLPFFRKNVFAPCPAGKFPISGGVFTEGRMNVTDNGPETVGGRAGWQGGVFNPQVDSSDVVVVAICLAKPSP